EQHRCQSWTDRVAVGVGADADDDPACAGSALGNGGHDSGAAAAKDCCASLRKEPSYFLCASRVFGGAQARATHGNLHWEHVILLIIVGVPVRGRLPVLAHAPAPDSFLGSSAARGDDPGA